jgi:hypothetical protein
MTCRPRSKSTRTIGGFGHEILPSGGVKPPKTFLPVFKKRVSVFARPSHRPWKLPAPKPSRLPRHRSTNRFLRNSSNSRGKDETVREQDMWLSCTRGKPLREPRLLRFDRRKPPFLLQTRSSNAESGLRVSASAESLNEGELRKAETFEDKLRKPNSSQRRARLETFWFLTSTALPLMCSIDC